MTLREEALAAYEAQVDARTTDARKALGAVLTPSDVSGLDAVHTEMAPGGSLAVFVGGDVSIGVWLRGESVEVTLVSLNDGRWTDGPTVRSLAHLGELLLIHDPADPEPTIAAWQTQVSYAVDAQVTYDGSVWRCTQAHTSQAGWEPPNVPALWNRVA